MARHPSVKWLGQFLVSGTHSVCCQHCLFANRRVIFVPFHIWDISSSEMFPSLRRGCQCSPRSRLLPS